MRSLIVAATILLLACASFALAQRDGKVDAKLRWAPSDQGDVEFSMVNNSAQTVCVYSTYAVPANLPTHLTVCRRGEGQTSPSNYLVFPHFRFVKLEPRESFTIKSWLNRALTSPLKEGDALILFHYAYTPCESAGEAEARIFPPSAKNQIDQFKLDDLRRETRAWRYRGGEIVEDARAEDLMCGVPDYTPPESAWD